MLRQSLESQGLHVERLHVQAAPQSPVQDEPGMNQQRAGAEEERGRFADAGQGRSRGRRDDQAPTRPPGRTPGAAFSLQNEPLDAMEKRP